MGVSAQRAGVETTTHRTITGLITLATFASLWGCEIAAPPEIPQALSAPIAQGKGDSPRRSSLPPGFPQEQDLAILVPMDAEPPLRADLRTDDGGVLLSATWLDQVSDAFEGTDVADAFEVESWYGDWRVVSVRIAPCGPLGHFPGHVTDAACWPQVRVVWEPVHEDFDLYGFIRVDRYADDRAVHALYRVQPNADATENSEALEAVLQQIADGRPLEDLDRDVLRAFAKERNIAMMRLTADAAGLRDAEASWDAWSGVESRVEYDMGAFTASDFQDRLYDFLASYAQPWALHELTSFSLPEGRSPASIDSWVFVAFEGAEGEITQKDLTVQSRTTGEVLVNIGLDQTVADNAEDEAVMEAMDDPRVGEELAEHVIIANSDAEILGDIIADPTRTFVSNTTCASCHRLTDLSFDFHTFSYFEDRDATISPRVIEDVANDLQILRAFLDTWPE